MNAGAIPIVKGNVSFGLCNIHTSNLIFGEAMNPYNFQRSCGGGSGGDAGLVTARCVPFAIGTELCGSLTIPTSFCGAYCFKPTAGRTTNRGIGSPLISRF